MTVANQQQQATVLAHNQLGSEVIRVEQCLDLLFGASIPLQNVAHAFAYGSGAVQQKGEDASTKMVDFVLVCNNSLLFHRDNLLRNPAHYSLLFRRLIDEDKLILFQRYTGARLFYNTMVPSKGRLIKYGVIETEDLETDLLDWEWLYAAGRLHKPVLDLSPSGLLGQRPDRNLQQAITDNRWMAIQAALLFLPQTFSMQLLLRQIVSLSYKGDIRMGWAEDAAKVDKLVSGAEEQLRQIYAPIIARDEWLKIISDSHIEQDCSTPAMFHRLQMLPLAAQRGLRNSYYPPSKYRGNYHSKWDMEELIFHIAYRYDVSERLDAVLFDIVRRSSKWQSVKNAITAGFVRSLKYGWPKLRKGIGKRFWPI